MVFIKGCLSNKIIKKIVIILIGLNLDFVKI